MILGATKPACFKEYAKEHGQSLSEMVENCSKLLTADRRALKEEKLSSKVKKLKGILKVESDFEKIPRGKP
ncbi:MAG: DUF6364 family protein [Mongoliitalea sp.]